MTTLTASQIPLTTEGAAQRLRRSAAAVRVHFTWWGVHKTLTSQQKEEVGSAYAADARFLTAGKKILDTRHEAFRCLTALKTRIVQFWKSQTLPYVEAGTRLIKQADVETFAHVMDGYQRELAEAEQGLNDVLTDLKTDARQRLGRLYNEADYPSEIRGLFGVAYDFPSVEPPSYLLRLSPEIYAQEQERVARRFEEAVRMAEEAFVSELARLVSHLTERLTAGSDGERKVFRDSAIHNLVEFFGQFSRLNVRSNAQLDALVEQAQQVVQGVRPQELRDNGQLRQHVATQLGQVQTALDEMLVDLPRRRILRPTPTSNGG